MKSPSRRVVRRLVLRRHRQLVTVIAVALLACLAVKVISLLNIESSDRSGPISCGSLETPVDGNGCLVAPNDYEQARVVATLVAVAATLTAVAGVVVLLQRPQAHIFGKKVQLRRIGVRDTRAVLATVDDGVVAVNRMPANWVDELRRAIRWTGLDTHLAICIGGTDEDDGTDEIVGIVTAAVNPFHRSRADIGIWIAAAHRGRDLAADAVAALVDHLHNQGFEQVGAETAADNSVMLSVLARTQFEIEGHRQRMFAADDIVDAIMLRHTRGAQTDEAVEHTASARQPGV